MKMNKNNYFFRRENHINLLLMKLFLVKPISVYYNLPYLFVVINFKTTS